VRLAADVSFKKFHAKLTHVEGMSLENSQCAAIGRMFCAPAKIEVLCAPNKFVFDARRENFGMGRSTKHPTNRSTL
jgi:hypothetical protein